jgi:hypothetical protein
MTIWRSRKLTMLPVRYWSKIFAIGVRAAEPEFAGLTAPLSISPQPKRGPFLPQSARTKKLPPADVLPKFLCRGSNIRTQTQGKPMFIVQGKPREPDQIKKVAATRKAALEAAVDFANQGLVLVAIVRVADGRVYTAEELAKAVINREE